ncbi:tautomerase family protein [Rhizobium sp. ZPR3]|uniref:tautomerase family protein n=1 Tax=unclassified Rhizobium TaxID=2613769 RepID=UPI0032ED1E58
MIQRTGPGRYQILCQHAPRADCPGHRPWYRTLAKFVLLEVISRPRPKQEKSTYRNLCKDLDASFGILASDVMIFLENTDKDWTF